MMKENFDAYELLLKQHYQELTPEEEVELNSILLTDPALIELQKEIQRIPKEEAENFLRGLNFNEEHDKIIKLAARIQLATPKRNRGAVYRPMVVAAAAAAVLIGTILFLKFKEIESPKARQVAQMHNGATLTLAGGELIAMSDTGHQAILAGNTPINNNNRSLSFGEGEASGSGLNVLIVPAKLDFQIELADGTKVWLNSTTRFRFPFSFNGETREVYIDKGEAYFQVAKNANKPFTVHTPTGPVKVLGTEFNVNAYTEGKVVTSLLSGKVAVYSGEESVELAPGSEAVAKKSGLTRNKDFDMTNTLSWREGIHYFNNTSITEVGIMLKRWFDVDLIIDNPTAGAIEIRGKLNRNLPLNLFIDQVNTMKLVEFYWKDNRLHCR